MSNENKQADEQPKKQTTAEMEAEIKQLELEAKRLEVQERTANVQDLKERLAERELKREAKRQNSMTNGATLRQQDIDQVTRERRCNHHKGSNGPHGYVNGQGDDSQYAVLKHTFLNGDTWVRCMRCGKTWKPPIQENFYYDANGKHVPPTSDVYGNLIPKGGKFNEAKYESAVAEYREALNFQTRNIPSSSYVFKFSDGGKFFRDVTNNATLR